MSQLKIFYFRGGNRRNYWGGLTSDDIRERKFFEMSRNLEKIKYSEENNKTLEDLEREYNNKVWERFNRKSEIFHQNIYEKYVGGFWYGNVDFKASTSKYCEKFNKEFKERVRAYWNYQCFECGTPQNGRALHIHHIHYNKKMCCDGSPHDVVPLCNSCHIRTNYNRNYWEKHFTELLYMYNPIGKCFFTKEEIIQWRKTWTL